MSKKKATTPYALRLSDGFVQPLAEGTSAAEALQVGRANADSGAVLVEQDQTGEWVEVDLGKYELPELDEDPGEYVMPDDET